jgi:DMSO/TMAO reductase YedYZ molybdopterin-dependent catalytic subunit
MIGGAIAHSRTWTAAELQALPATTLPVTFATEHGTQQGRWTGVLLWTLLDQAGIAVDSKVHNAVLQHTILITGRDGYAVALSVGELSPAFGADPALIAYARDGASLPAVEGLRLVVPGDKAGGRAVRDVVRIDVK